MFRSSEQKNFAALIEKHLDLQDGPLLMEGTTGLGKTRAYLYALANTSKRVAVVLPTHQLIDQLLASADLQATGLSDIATFRPARMFDTRDKYQLQKDKAQSARVMLCTAASVIIDQRLSGEYNGATTRDYMLFDEADQLPDMAALQSDFKITQNDLSEIGIKLTTANETLNAILAKAPRTVEPEVRAAARIILEAIEAPAWFHKAGITDDGGIVLSHTMPGRLLKKISNRPNVAFISATLSVDGKFDDFKNTMGINRISSLSSIIEPENHGHLTFEITALDVESPEWFPAVVDKIKSAPRPTLVITPSHALADQLASEIAGAIKREGSGEEREDTSQAARRVPNDGVLIAASAWAGLDTSVQWKSVIIPRVPFGQPLIVEGEISTHYLTARNTAIRRMRQGIGRGLRTPDARCTIVILDQRVAKLSGFVPQRFSKAWPANISGSVEGERTEIVLSKAERDPALRKSALKKYGSHCMGKSCNSEIKHPSQLDVHHLDPIAEGVRRTTLDDLVVLCANCHRLAHHLLRNGACLELDRNKKAGTG